jgi:hypothetical protein
MRRKWKWFFIIPIFMALFVFIGGEIVMHLWNWLLPLLFGWRMVTFWQAVGILVLCRILFGGLMGGRGPRSRIREKMRERMEFMTPEEREQFRQRMRARCGFGATPTEAKEGQAGS